MLWLIPLAIAQAPADPTRAPPPSVVGGVPAAEDRWPQMAALFSPDEIFICGGILLSSEAVLTAAHCAWNVSHVRLGASDHADGGETLAVDEVAMHPDPHLTFDLAILHLQSPSTIPPISLPPPCLVEAFLREGAPVTLLGYGATDPEGITQTSALHEAHTQITDPACVHPEEGCYEAILPGGELIAGGEGVDTCVGDSGGPLFLAEPGDWLVGITSRGIRSTSRACGQGGIYVRVDAARAWIEDQLPGPLGPLDCEGINLPPILDPLPEIQVRPGGLVSMQIEASDPDPDDTLRFHLVEPPTLGFAQLDEAGELRFVAPLRSGHTSLRFAVTDDGAPPRTTEATLNIEILGSQGRSPRGCQCGHASTPGLLSALLGLSATLWTRRRRRGSGIIRL